MRKRFEPIGDKCGLIVDYIMDSPDMPQDEGIKFKIRLCSEEVVENVVSYAYESGVGFLEVAVEKEGDILVLSFKDAGKPFDPLDKPDPDITLGAEEREIGGLGIFLCKQMMDEVTYNFEDGCNKFTMKIKIN